MNLIQQVRNDLTLSEKRKRHTEGVVHASLLLAKRHFPSLPREQVELAALLHDFTKEYTTEKQKQLCLWYGIPVDEATETAPKLFHAQTAAAIAREVYRAPEEVCSAVRWHTTGRPNMSPLELVLYLADYIEENRTYVGCVRLRQYYETKYRSMKNKEIALQKTLVRSFDVTLRDLLREQLPIDRMTVDARNYYLTAKGLTQE